MPDQLLTDAASESRASLLALPSRKEEKPARDPCALFVLNDFAPFVPGLKVFMKFTCAHYGQQNLLQGILRAQVDTYSHHLRGHYAPQPRRTAIAVAGEFHVPAESATEGPVRPVATQ